MSFTPSNRARAQKSRDTRIHKPIPRVPMTAPQCRALRFAIAAGATDGEIFGALDVFAGNMPPRGDERRQYLRCLANLAHAGWLHREPRAGIVYRMNNGCVAEWERKSALLAAKGSK